MRELLRFTGKILLATISCVADRWFVSLIVDTEDPLNRAAENQGVVGMDLGVAALATLSTEEVITWSKPIRHLLFKGR
jgi:putative transposase